ncbi:MAG TPA: hypothetical protein VFQ99_01780 [Gallionella sp.]|nr:hypothetical protein [Gallionella sp.]
MKQKAALLAAILVSVAASVAAAEESGANKPVKGVSHIEEKTDAAAGGHKLDFKELFGCEPMGEGGHMPMPEPASGASQQGAMPPMQDRGPMPEKH